jgi:hypothetical protein
MTHVHILGIPRLFITSYELGLKRFDFVVRKNLSSDSCNPPAKEVKILTRMEKLSVPDFWFYWRSTLPK